MRTVLLAALLVGSTMQIFAQSPGRAPESLNNLTVALSASGTEVILTGTVTADTDPTYIAR